MPPHRELTAPPNPSAPSAPRYVAHGVAVPLDEWRQRLESGRGSVRQQIDQALDVLRRALRYWWVVALIGILGSAAAYGVVSLRAEFYQSETIIMHRDVIPSDLLLRSGGGSAGLRSMHSRFSEMLRAKPLLVPIIEDSGIFADLVEAEGMEAAVEEMRALTRFRSRGGGMFNISFRARDPELARDITRQLAQGLIDWELRLKLESASVTSDFMAEERARLTAELAAREREMAQFLAAHPEFAVDNQQESSGPGASIRALGGRATRAPGARGSRRDLSDLVDLERRRGELKAQLRGRRRADGPLSRALRDRERIRRELDGLRSQYTERHPDVVAAVANLTEANRVIQAKQAALQSELESLTPQIIEKRKDVARRTRRTDSKTARRGKRRVASLVGLETEWAELLREFRALQERHKAIESKAFVADMSASSELARQGTQLTVVSAATLPTSPSGFPSWLLLAAGIAASIGGGFALVLARVLLDDRVYSRGDLETVDAPILVVIPQS